MSARSLPRGPRFTIQGLNLCQALTLLLAALAVLVSACESAPPPTSQWTPSYLELNLYAGKARLQWPGESDWKTMEGKSNVSIREGARISSDAEGAKFFLGDGSTLELAPETTIEMQNPRTLPRLQLIVEKGSILFFGQKPSYEFALAIYPVRLLSVPSLIRIEVDGETNLLAVEEGAVTCEIESEALTLPTCRQMVVEAGEEPEFMDFCTLSTVEAPPTPTASPSPTPVGFVPTVTSTASPTATPTSSASPTPTRGVVAATPTHTSAPPTAEPPTSKPKPKKTQPPPTQPPPTQPPPTQPPPTQPPPTPEPTQPRPTPKPPEPTAEPSKPTAEAPQPTAEAPKPTAESSKPTTEAPRPTVEFD